jgi:putative serine protease PepD
MRSSSLWVPGLVLAGIWPAPLQGRSTEPVAEPAPASARALSEGFSRVARAIAPSVVRLEVSGVREDAVASGIILDTRGNVVTSSHAFDGWSPPPARDGAEPIAVVLADGRRSGAELIGLDPGSDVAVVRMFNPPHDLCAARFGDSDSAEAGVGEWVLMVGSPLGLDETFTAGIISGRPASDRTGAPAPDGALARGGYLLTDAAINPGESGGPLVDLDGEVIGMATAMSAGPGGSYGYAVPINRARRVAVALIKDGRLTHPFIGVGVRDLDDLDSGERRRLGVLPARGALVSRVWRGAPAARAGLLPGDVITSVNDDDTPTPSDLVAAIARQEIGARIVVGFVRGGATQVVPISIADLPSAPGPGAPSGP